MRNTFEVANGSPGGRVQDLEWDALQPKLVREEERVCSLPSGLDVPGSYGAPSTQVILGSAFQDPAHAQSKEPKCQDEIGRKGKSLLLAAGKG